MAYQWRMNVECKWIRFRFMKGASNVNKSIHLHAESLAYSRKNKLLACSKMLTMLEKIRPWGVRRFAMLIVGNGNNILMLARLIATLLDKFGDTLIDTLGDTLRHSFIHIQVHFYG